MAKMRVHELAKELNKTSKEVINALQKQGVEVQSHMSTISDENVDKLKKAFQPAQEKQNVKPQTDKTKTFRQSFENRDADRPRERRDNRNGEGRTYNRDNRNGEGRTYNNNRNGENRSYNRDNRNGEGRTYNNNRNGEGRTYNNNRNGEGRTYNNNRNGEGRTYNNNRNGEGRTYNNNRDGENRSYNKDSRNGEGRTYNNNRNGENRSYNRDNRNGEGRTYNNNRNGEGRTYNNNRNGEGRTYNNNRDGENRSYNNRGYNRDDNRNSYNKDNDNRNDNRNHSSQDRPRKSSASMGGDLPINPKGNGKENRHTINREHSKNDNNRNNDNKNGRNNGRRNNKVNVNSDYNNEQKRPKNKKNQKPVETPAAKPAPKEETIRNITLPDPVSLKDLAESCKVTPATIIKKLFLGGKMVTINTEFSFDEAAEIALEYNCIAEEEVKVDIIEELLKEEEEDESTLTSRPPVVCVMGHVDHGKTSLLDRIRSTNVTAGEAGGITQHIGAYVVSINGQKITFLDTPGHEAFTSMRLRGAQATDIAILVVAADDGVMPQTIEAINHAKAAGVEVIVAVNKIDKEGANVDRVKQELTEYGLIAEDWGGSTVFVPVSAKTGEGIEDLLEMITLTAEVLELKANAKRKARGLVIEAKLDKGRGPVATILIQKGTLHVGDAINVGHSYGKVRAMIDDQGNRVKVAGPSVPVEILGLNDVPFSGEVLMAHDNEKDAHSTADAFIAYSREKMLEETKSKMSLDDLFTQIQAGNLKELNIVVKADVQGSVEAVRQSLVKLSNEEVMIKVIHGAVGAINESDVVLASASNAIIIGFNVRPDAQAKSLAETEKVDMRLYRVIYNAIEDIEAAMKGMLDPVFQEKIIGHLEVRQLYRASGVGTIAGCYVTDGVIQRDAQVRLVRDGIVVYDGKLASLKRFKDDAKEVRSGFECGLSLERFNDIKENDQIEGYVMEEIPR